MAHDCIYTFEEGGPRKSRRRFEIVIADTSPITDRDVRIPIPPGAISVAPPTNSAFANDTAVGPVKGATYTVTVDTRYLRGTPELDALALGLVRDFQAPGGGVLDVGGGNEIEFMTGNTWTIYANHSGDSEGLFREEFIGVQVVKENAVIDVYIGQGAIYTFDLVALPDICMQRVTMRAVTAALRDKISHPSPWLTTAYREAVDIGYDTGTHSRFWRHRGGKISLIQFVTIFEAIEDLLGQAVGAFLRLGVGGLCALRSPGIAEVGGMPYDAWRLYRQNGLLDHERGTALARDEWGVIAAVRRQEDADAAEPIGGLLYSSGGQTQDSLHAWDNVSLYLGACSSAAGVRMVPRVVSDRAIEIVFYRLYRAGTTTQLSMDDIIIEAGVARQKIQFSKRVGLLTIQLRGGQGDDETKYEYGDKAAGSGAGVSAIWDTSPTMATKDWVTVLIPGGGYPGGSTAFDNPRVYLWKFYYLGRIAGMTEDRPIRVHDTPDYRVASLPNAVEVDYADYAPISWPALNGSDDHLEANAPAFIRVIRASIAAIQETRGMQNAMGPVLVEVFGRFNLPKYPMRVRMNDAALSYRGLGEAFILPPATLGIDDANGLIATGRDELPMSGWCILVNWKPNPDTGIADVILQGLHR